MALPAIITWFGSGWVPAALLAVGGLSAIAPKQFGFLDNKVGPTTVKVIWGVASVAAAVALWM